MGLLAFAGVAWLVASPVALGNGDAELREGLALFTQFQDEKASRALEEAIKLGLEPQHEATAHLYLGLIAFNRLKGDLARSELRKALALNPFLEIPQDWSPKLKVFFNQVRHDALEQGEALTAAKRVEPREPTPVPLVLTPAPEPQATLAKPEPSGSSHLPSYLVGAGAAAALGVGITFGVLQSSARSSLTSTSFTDSNQLTSARQAVATDGLVADVLFGVAGAAAITAVVLFLVTGSSGTETAGLVASPTGYVLGGAF